MPNGLRQKRGVLGLPPAPSGVSPGGTPSLGRIAGGQAGEEAGGFDPWTIGATAVVGGISSLLGGRERRKDRESRERMAREQREHELEMLRRQNLLPDWIYAIVKRELSAPIGPHGGFARAVQSTQSEQPQLPVSAGQAGAGPPPVTSRLGGGR